jgi:hypothetical protein
MSATRVFVCEAVVSASEMATATATATALPIMTVSGQDAWRRHERAWATADMRAAQDIAAGTVLGAVGGELFPAQTVHMTCGGCLGTNPRFVRLVLPGVGEAFVDVLPPARFRTAWSAAAFAAATAPVAAAVANVRVRADGAVVATAPVRSGDPLVLPRRQSDPLDDIHAGAPFPSAAMFRDAAARAANYLRAGVPVVDDGVLRATYSVLVPALRHVPRHEDKVLVLGIALAWQTAVRNRVAAAVAAGA